MRVALAHAQYNATILARAAHVYTRALKTIDFQIYQT